MIEIIISDSSAIIDLAKVRLIENLLRLPYEFIIPDTLYEDELITLEHYEKHELLDLGFKVGTLDGQGMMQAAQFFQTYSGPTLNDFIALTLAMNKKNSLLLTGDNKLRKIAKEQKVNAHGVLWIFDEISHSNTAGKNELLLALRIWQQDKNVWLPNSEIQKRIDELTK